MPSSAAAAYAGGLERAEQPEQRRERGDLGRKAVFAFLPG
jgi:hypothetical protein